MNRILATAAALALAAIAWTGAQAQDNKVKVGVTTSSSDAGVFIAQDRGYFRDQGLEIELVPFTSGLPMFSAIAASQVDVARMAQSAGLFNSFGRGIDLKLVADGGSLSKGGGYLAVALRKDLADSGAIKGAADFKGRRVAIAGSGGTSDIVLDRFLRSGGLSIADVQRTPISIPDQLAAMSNKNIDAAIALEPIMSAMIKNGFAVRFKGGDEIYPDMQAAVLAYSSEFAKRAEAGRKFMAGYLRGVRDYNDAFFHDKGFDGVVAVLMKHTSIKDPQTYRDMVPAGLDPNGKLNIEGLKWDQDWYAQQDLVKQKVDVAKFVDQSFAEAAVKALGPYKP